MKTNILNFGINGVYDDKTTIEREPLTDDLVIKTNTDERMRIKDAADVEIVGNNANDEATLTLHDTRANVDIDESIGAFQAISEDTNGTLAGAVRASIEVVVTNTYGWTHAWVFKTRNYSNFAERMRITEDGIIVAGNIDLSAGDYITLPGGCRDWGKRATAPTSPAPVEGDRYWLTGTGMKYYNGSTWS